MSRRSQTIDLNRRRTRSVRHNSNLKLQVQSHIAREIWAVIYFALGTLTILSLTNQLGIFGEIWEGFLHPIFGWGIYVFPGILILLGFSLLFSKQINIGFTKLFGLFLMAVSILGTLHLSVPDDQMFAVAELGGHGGYIGFVSAFLIKSILGGIGTQVVFITMFVISILITFEISIASALSFFKPEMPIKIERVISKSGKKMRINQNGEVEEIKDLEVDLDDINIIAPEKPSAGLKSIEKQKPIPIKELDKFTNELTNKSKTIEAQAYTQWEYPTLDLLDNKVGIVNLDNKFLKDKAETIKRKLAQFGIEVAMGDIHVGPTVVQYTLRPAEDIKLSKITALKNDLALSLSAHSVRIEAPIPGKSLVGIEIPNLKRAVVYMREIIETEEYQKEKSKLKIALGRTVNGTPIVSDITTMPHLLIAGATGSGKSVAVNSFLISLLYNNSPAELKFIMVDPKQVELKKYNSIPHLLTPVITEPDKAATALRWCVCEMTRRYSILSNSGTRNIDEHNQTAEEKMPKIIIVIDELADLMMTAGKEVEASICRIAQMARAVGMHLIVATQRPSVDVVTGLIKANIPARIAFAVASGIDSRTMINCFGAEDLLGNGDMLYLSGALARLQRIQGIYVSTEEVNRVTNRIKCTLEPEYLEDIISKKITDTHILGIPDSTFSGENGIAEDNDEMTEQALQVIKQTGKASASLLQRRLSVGYARAARLLDIMEEKGFIGPVNGAKARDIYI